MVNAADIPHVDTSGLSDLVESCLAVTRREGGVLIARSSAQRRSRECG